MQKSATACRRVFIKHFLFHRGERGPAVAGQRFGLKHDFFFHSFKFDYRINAAIKIRGNCLHAYGLIYVGICIRFFPKHIFLSSRAYVAEGSLSSGVRDSPARLASESVAGRSTTVGMTVDKTHCELNCCGSCGCWQIEKFTGSKRIIAISNFFAINIYIAVCIRI